MTNSPTYTKNSPASGTQYNAPNSGYWFIPNSGSSVSTTVTTSNGTVVSSLTAINRDISASSNKSSFTYNGGNSVTTTSSNGTNGSDIFAPGGEWGSGSGTPSAISMHCSYTGSPCLPTNLSLSAWTATEGTVITVTGKFLDGVTSIKFGGVSATFTITNSNYSSGSISVTVPNGAVTGSISFNSPNGSSIPGTFYIVPTISSLSVTSAITGSNILIFGTGFNSTTSVTFPQSAVNATITINSDTQITATVPTDSGSGNIVVTNTGGYTASYGTFNTTPTISGYNVSSGTVGTSVTITGTGFTQVSAVSFYNNVSATYTVVSNTQITTTVPSGATTGGITVTTASGSVTGTTFSVLPSVSSITPTSGHVGDSVTISGSGFTGTTAVRFYNAVSASFTVVNDGSITTTVPAGAVKGAISVTNAGGTASSTSFGVLPYISGISPNPAPPGTSVTISGSGFTGTTAVTFYNNIAATVFTVVNDSTITATVPSGSTSGPVSVTNASGTATSGSLTVSSIHVYRTGAWTQAQNIYVYRSGAWVAANGVFVYRSGSWVSAG